MLLLFDNYDSFTYNVYQLLSEIGAEVEVIRNDVATIDEIKSKNFSAIVISPGLGIPRDAGLTEDLIREFKDQIPILGICLGHQARGIVADSIPFNEYQEILQKSKALFEVVEEVENDVIAFR